MLFFFVCLVTKKALFLDEKLFRLTAAGTNIILFRRESLTFGKVYLKTTLRRKLKQTITDQIQKGKSVRFGEKVGNRRDNLLG